MTIEQAMQRMEREKKALELCLEAFATVSGLAALGELDKAVELYASAWRTLQKEFDPLRSTYCK